MSLHDPALSPGQADLLRRFVEHVRGSPHNLVSRRARGELESRHVPEAVAFAGLLSDRAHRLLDVGSGGGFPGLVIAIVRPDLEVHLLEATGKKVEFLAQTAADLGLEVTVHHGRAESLACGALAGSFDLVTARAVAPIRELLDFTIPFLAPHGMLYAIKGERWATELDEATDRLTRVGARVLATPEELGPGAADDPGAPRVVVIGRAR